MLHVNFVDEQENMLDLCDLHKNTLVRPTDRSSINQYIIQRNQNIHQLPVEDGNELRRIWNYVYPQTVTE